MEDRVLIAPENPKTPRIHRLDGDHGLVLRISKTKGVTVTCVTIPPFNVNLLVLLAVVYPSRIA